MLSGEYLVLDGAEALALGLQVGQRMRVEDVPGDGLEWESTEKDGSVWFSARFAADGTLQEASDAAVAARLKSLLAVCREENPRFDFSGKRVCLHAEFDRSWGLGSSSTLIYTLAQWAQVDPFALVRRRGRAAVTTWLVRVSGRGMRCCTVWSRESPAGRRQCSVRLLPTGFTLCTAGRSRIRLRPCLSIGSFPRKGGWKRPGR